MVRSALLAFVVSLLAAATASASAVSVDGAQLVFRGAGAEQNNVSIGEMPARDAYSVSDGKAPMDRGPGCEKGGTYTSNEGFDSYDGFATYCRRDGVTNVLIDLGDGDDHSFGIVNVPTTILGGAGADGIEGPLDGLADGGPGNDNIAVPVGRATVQGGPGRDLLTMYESSGTDPKGSAQPGLFVRQDGIANDGPVGDAHANVTGFERFIGGPRADVLYGSSRDDDISGDTGPDQLHGGAGDDRINAIDAYSPANHEVHDVFSHYSHWRDRVWCGPGNDRVSAGLEDRWSSDCERVTVYATRFVRDPADVDHDTEVVARVVLNGDRRANNLVGARAHPNYIYARGGADRIRGGAKRDVVSAGAGADVIHVAGGGRDIVHCGSGQDRVVADIHDRVGRDCEVVVRRGR